MSIIAFWNDDKEQSGRTLTSVAVATNMSIERNSKVLLISTSVGDNTLKNCFWKEQNTNSGFFGTKNNVNIGVESGLEGLFKLISSKKLTPSIITDYTKVIFKDRLEILVGLDKLVNPEHEQCYLELIKTANQYYDFVIVDIDKRLNAIVKNSILAASDVNVYVLSQRLESIKRYNTLKNEKQDLMKNRCVPVIGKYMSKYKYNSKNIARFLKEKKEMDLMPLNLLYMEAAEEATVVDLLLKLKNVKDKNDENYIFMQCLQNLTNNIIRRLQEMQMKMR